MGNSCEARLFALGYPAVAFRRASALAESATALPLDRCCAVRMLGALARAGHAEAVTVLSRVVLELDERSGCRMSDI